MANWSNLRLVVTGYSDDLAGFRREAGAFEGLIDTRNSTVFTPEMEEGEGGWLEADNVSVFRRKFRRTSYRFQGRNDDHVDHFITISRRFPRLAFVLVWNDTNGDTRGSYLLVKGRARKWHVPCSVHTKLVNKHYRLAGVVNANGEIDYETDEEHEAHWDALFEMMDRAQAHWDGSVSRYLTRQVRPPDAASSPAASPASEDVFIDVEMLGTRGAPVALLGVLAGDRHTLYLLDERLQTAAIAIDEHCCVSAGREAIETVVNLARKTGGHIVSWSTHDRRQIHRLRLPARLTRQFDALHVNALQDVRRWKTRLYPKEKLPRLTLDDAQGGHSLKAYMAATGFRSANQMQPVTAAARLRHVLERIENDDGGYRGLTRLGKRHWHQLLRHNRVDCEALKHVWERAVGELALEQAYRATVFRSDSFRHDVSVCKHAFLSTRAWSPEWVVITACNPQSKRLTDGQNMDRDIALRRRLDKDDRLYCHVVSAGAPGRPTEPSVAVHGISRGKAIALARELGQAAIVCGKRRGRAELVWCNTLNMRAT